MIYLKSIEISLLLHFIDKQWSLNINPGHIWQSRLKHNSELNSDDQWRIKGFGGPGQKKCARLHVRYSAKGAGVTGHSPRKISKMDLLCVGGILGVIIHSVFNLSGGAKVNLVVSSYYLQFIKEKKRKKWAKRFCLWYGWSEIFKDYCKNIFNFLFLHYKCGALIL